MDIGKLQTVLKSIEIDGQAVEFAQLIKAAEDTFEGEVFVIFGTEERYLWLVIDGHVSLGNTPLSCIDEELLEVANAIADLFGM